MKCSAVQSNIYSVLVLIFTVHVWRLIESGLFLGGASLSKYSTVCLSVEIYLLCLIKCRTVKLFCMFQDEIPTNYMCKHTCIS